MGRPVLVTVPQWRSNIRGTPRTASGMKRYPDHWRGSRSPGIELTMEPTRIERLFATGIICKSMRPKLRRARRYGKRLALKMKVLTRRTVRLIVGSGGTSIRGWIPSDVDQLDILIDRHWRFYFRKDSLEAILAEHVWEHFTPDQAIDAAALCYRYLRPGGHLRIAVPDGLHPDPTYICAVKPGGVGAGANDHKVMYTWRTIQAVLEKAGFMTRLLEYFDENGNFHTTDWNEADGLIHRSWRFDERNREGKPRYTSIIIDAIKPSLT